MAIEFAFDCFGIPDSTGGQKTGMSLVDNAALGGIRHMCAVLGEHATRVLVWRRGPLFTTPLELRLVNAQLQRLGVDVDRDRITIAGERYRAAILCLGHDVAHDQPVAGNDKGRAAATSGALPIGPGPTPTIFCLLWVHSSIAF